jgi:penicillin-binding protein 1C
MGPSSYFRQPPRGRSSWHASPRLGRVTLGGRPATSWGSRRPVRPPHRFRLGRLLRWAAVTVLCGVAALVVLVLWYSRDLPDPNRLIDRTVAQTTKLYDRTGEQVLYEIHGAEKRSIVPLDSIPLIMRQATLVAEDRGFYNHGGISIRGIIRAGLSHLTGIGRGGGGSTLTQQLVKNAILTNEKRISRKLRELVLAWRIEQRFSKDEILQMYLNEIPYGGTSYGVQSAAQSYFSKDVGQLTLAESATLAAITNAPSSLSPYTTQGLERLTGRTAYVLKGMVEEGYITADQAAAATAEKLSFTPRRDAIAAPHFSMWVYQQLVDKYGARTVEEGGLKVITTLDIDLQTDAESAVASRTAQNSSRYNAKNAALVALDVPTGQVRAMVGSADFFDESIDGQVNVATAPRQPGSSFKPIVYAAAFALGYSPQTVLFDLVTSFPTDQGPYNPKNYNQKEHGPVTMRQALAGSLNIPAVKTLYLAGIDRVLELSKALGYSSLNDPSRFGLSLVLGGGEVSLLEHVTSYATFARNGSFVPYSSILRVEASDGRVLEEWQQPRGVEALRPDVAAVLTDVLSDNNSRAFIFGATNSLTLPDRPVATKTGTTNDYHDAWTVGYTPQIAAGVWVGNSDNEAMSRGADGSVVAAPIWQRFMIAAHRSLPAQSFAPMPAPFNVSQKPMLNGQWDGAVTQIYDSRTGLLATPATPPEFTVERVYRQVHSILHWVIRGDPLGAVPSDPSSDPAYAAWEAPVARWREAKGITNEDVPGVGSSGDSGVSISILEPQAGAIIEGGTLTVSATTNNGSGNDWRFSVDGTIIGHSSQGATIITLPSSLYSGNHVLSITVVTNDGRAGAISIPFTYNRPRQSPLGVTIPPTALVGASVSFSVQANSEVRQVDFYVQPPVGQTRWVGVATKSPDGSWVLVWPGPAQVGTYVIAAMVTDTSGNTNNVGAWILQAS